MIALLQVEDEAIASAAAASLSKILLVYDAFHDIEELMKAGNPYAKQVMEAWANAEWFTHRSPLPEAITVTVFKVPGEDEYR